MNKRNLLIVCGIVIVVIAAILVWKNCYKWQNNAVGSEYSDYKSIEYVINGQKVRLGNEVRYFGNDLKTDLDGDGREDIVFLVTHHPGGTGTFYYAVGAINTESGYVGTDGYSMGDRISPQSINVSTNPVHKNVIVVNYADRAPGEPMAAFPTVGRSAYIKLDRASMMWGIVVPNFEGESR